MQLHWHLGPTVTGAAILTVNCLCCPRVNVAGSFRILLLQPGRSLEILGPLWTQISAQASLVPCHRAERKYSHCSARTAGARGASRCLYTAQRVSGRFLDG